MLGSVRSREDGSSLFVRNRSPREHHYPGPLRLSSFVQTFCGVCVFCRLAGWWSSLSLSLLLLLLPKVFSFSLPTPRQEQQQHRSSGKVGSHRRERERGREREPGTRKATKLTYKHESRFQPNNKNQEPRIKRREREREREGGREW